MPDKLKMKQTQTNLVGTGVLYSEESAEDAS